jgi:hypothetical protein
MERLGWWWVAILVTCTPGSGPAPGDAGTGGGNGLGGGTADAGQVSCNGYGGGIEFIMWVDPQTVDFSSVAEGTTSAAREVTITSDGSQGGAVEFSVVGAGAESFSIDAGSCHFVGPHPSTCHFEAFFRPMTLGDAGATLVLSSWGTGACISLSGVGVTP